LVKNGDEIHDDDENLQDVLDKQEGKNGQACDNREVL